MWNLKDGVVKYLCYRLIYWVNIFEFMIYVIKS